MLSPAGGLFPSGSLQLQGPQRPSRSSAKKKNRNNSASKSLRSSELTKTEDLDRPMNDNHRWGASSSSSSLVRWGGSSSTSFGLVAAAGGAKEGAKEEVSPVPPPAPLSLGGAKEEVSPVPPPAPHRFVGSGRRRRGGRKKAEKHPDSSRKKLSSPEESTEDFLGMLREESSENPLRMLREESSEDHPMNKAHASRRVVGGSFAERGRGPTGRGGSSSQRAEVSSPSPPPAFKILSFESPPPSTSDPSDHVPTFRTDFSEPTSERAHGKRTVLFAPGPPRTVDKDVLLNQKTRSRPSRLKNRPKAASKRRVKCPAAPVKSLPAPREIIRHKSDFSGRRRKGWDDHFHSGRNDETRGKEVSKRPRRETPESTFWRNVVLLFMGEEDEEEETQYDVAAAEEVGAEEEGGAGAEEGAATEEEEEAGEEEKVWSHGTGLINITPQKSYTFFFRITHTCRTITMLCIHGQGYGL